MIGIDDLHVIIDVGRNTLDERNLVFYGCGIGHRKGRRAMGAGAHSVHGAAARFNPHKVVAEIVHLLLDARLAGFADSYHADHRSDTDGDAHDRQQAAHLVS